MRSLVADADHYFLSLGSPSGSVQRGTSGGAVVIHYSSADELPAHLRPRALEEEEIEAILVILSNIKLVLTISLE